jgi:hypothetical protein
LKYPQAASAAGMAYLADSPGNSRNCCSLHPMIRLAAIVSCLALMGCGAAPARESQSAELGTPFTLAPGATVSVKSAAMKVTFVSVTEDSRCPRDVACIWAGEVKVQLEIQQASQAASQVEIPEGGSTVAGACRVTLVRIEPQPASTARIAPQDYRATLRVDKEAR